MTRGKYLETLTNYAKVYRKDAKKSIFRNKHMNGLNGKELVTQKIIDALLVDFINYVGVQQCMDYGLYTSDLQFAENLEYWTGQLIYADWKTQFSIQLRGDYDGQEVYQYKLNSFGPYYFYIDFPRDLNGNKTGDEIKLFYCTSDNMFIKDHWESVEIPENAKGVKEKLIELGFNIT